MNSFLRSVATGLFALTITWSSMDAIAGAAIALPSLAPMIRVASPAVVNIATRGTLTEALPRNPLMEDPFYRRFFNAPNGTTVRRRKFQSAGSGVIVDARKGYIVTNRHVIENASEITVTLFDDRHFTATVVGSDEGTDLAVLKTEEQHLTEMPLGDSAHLEVGDWVVAIGNPFGLQHTVTVGIVSALGRTGINPHGYEDFIQTDASINPGNSGGALINIQGELVGINSAILSSREGGGNIGIGFAIPVNMVKAVLQQLITYGAVKRGALGIRLGDVSPDEAEALGLEKSRGVRILQLAPGSPAERAGIQVGDIVVSLNGVALESVAQLRNAIALLREGQTVELRVLHKGTIRAVSVPILGRDGTG